MDGGCFAAVRDEGAAMVWRWRVLAACCLTNDSAVLGCGTMLCPSHKCRDLPRCQVAEPGDLMQVSEHLGVVRALQESEEE